MMNISDDSISDDSANADLLQRLESFTENFYQKHKIEEAILKNYFLFAKTQNKFIKSPILDPEKMNKMLEKFSQEKGEETLDIISFEVEALINRSNLNEPAEMLEELNQETEEETLKKIFLQIEALDQYDIDVAYNLNELTKMLDELNQETDAELQTLFLEVEALGQYDIDVACKLNKIADMLNYSGKYIEAKKCYQINFNHISRMCEELGSDNVISQLLYHLHHLVKAELKLGDIPSETMIQFSQALSSAVQNSHNEWEQLIILKRDNGEMLENIAQKLAEFGAKAEAELCEEKAEILNNRDEFIDCIKSLKFDLANYIIDLQIKVELAEYIIEENSQKLKQEKEVLIQLFEAAKNITCYSDLGYKICLIGDFFLDAGAYNETERCYEYAKSLGFDYEASCFELMEEKKTILAEVTKMRDWKIEMDKQFNMDAEDILQHEQLDVLMNNLSINDFVSAATNEEKKDVLINNIQTSPLPHYYSKDKDNSSFFSAGASETKVNSEELANRKIKLDSEELIKSENVISKKSGR